MPSIQKNDLFEAEVTDLTHEGLGVAHYENFPIFMENALLGERVKCRVLKVGKSFAYGRVEAWLTTSPYRVKDIKLEYLRTGIADLGHLAYNEQLKFKTKQVRDVLSKLAGLNDFPLMETLAAESQVAYRNKAQVPVRIIKGQLETGFFRKNSHDLLPLEDFYLHHSMIDQVILYLRDYFRKTAVSAYDERTQRGLIRNIVVRRGCYTGELMVVLVATADKLPASLVSALVERFPSIKSVQLNINPTTGNAIFGKQFKLLAGQDFIRDEMLGKSFHISAQSFYQVNTAQAERLYRLAYDFAELKPTDTIVDAYSGIGTIGLLIADRVKAVYGMEIVPAAVSNAQKNAELNHITNAHYETGAAEAVLPQWLKQGIQPDIIFVDPPRKGLDESFITASAAAQPRAIVYISCNPATFARDVARYQNQGYWLEKAQPVDLFPQTHHVELVGLLKRKEP